jgi:hypothetical protein
MTSYHVNFSDALSVKEALAILCTNYEHSSNYIYVCYLIKNLKNKVVSEPHGTTPCPFVTIHPENLSTSKILTKNQ